MAVFCMKCNTGQKFVNAPWLLIFLIYIEQCVDCGIEIRSIERETLEAADEKT